MSVVDLKKEGDAKKDTQKTDTKKDGDAKKEPPKTDTKKEGEAKAEYASVVVDTKPTPTDPGSTSIEPFADNPAGSNAQGNQAQANQDQTGQAQTGRYGRDGQDGRTFEGAAGGNKTEVQGETTGDEPKPEVASAVEPPKLDSWDDKKYKLRDVPPPIDKVLDLPDFVKPPPAEEDPEFGQKTNKSLGFTYYAYVNAVIFFVAAIYSLIAGFVILGERYPIGLASLLCFVIAVLFAAAGVVQLVGFLNNKNKPVPHMVTTVVVNFIIFSALLVAILQIVMEDSLFAYAKETFKLRFARYAYRFIKEDIDKLFDNIALPYILIGIITLGAVACGILSLIQCCYYIPMSWWNIVCCIILPVAVIVLGLSVGVVFVCLSFLATPFSHTNKSDFSAFEVESPSGGYFQKAGIVLMVVSGGLILYIVVVVVSAKCYFNYKQKVKADKGLGWPDSDKVTYEYFRKDDFSVPFGTVARNVLAVCLGVVGLAIVLVVVILLPTKDSDKFTLDEGRAFLAKACTGFDTLPFIMAEDVAETQALTVAGASFVSLSSPPPPPTPTPVSTPAPSPTPVSTPAPSPTRTADPVTHANNYSQTRVRFMLGFEERNPCADASESVRKFLVAYKNITDPPTEAAVVVLRDMTEATRRLVITTSVLAIAPLFPVLIMVILLIAILLCAICCLPVVAVCIFGPKDSRAKIEKSALEWKEELDKGPITLEQNHTTLLQKKESIEERITKFNTALTELTERKDQLTNDVTEWSVQATSYQEDPTMRSLQRHTELEKERKALEKRYVKFNTNIEDYL